MNTLIIDPRNTTKPYNFCFFWALKKKEFPFKFLGYIPDYWGEKSPVKGDNLFLPISRGISENKKVQKIISNLTQTSEIFIGHYRLRKKLEKFSSLHFLWFTSPTVEQHLIPKITHKRLIHTAHNLLPHRNKASDFEKFRKLYSCMNFVIVHDKESKDKFHKMFQINTNVLVIRHGNLEDFYNVFDITNNDESKLFWTHKLGNLKRPIFLFMGPIKPYKGLDTLIKGAGILNRKGYSYSLVIKDKNPIYMKNIYVFSIKVPYSKLGLIYRNADVIILPHKEISQSVTLFEAGYFEKAVIVSSAGGLKETVRDGVDGFIFKKGDPYSLSLMMEKFIKSTNKCTIMGRNFKDNLIKKHSWDDIVEEYIKLYQEINL